MGWLVLVKFVVIFVVDGMQYSMHLCSLVGSSVSAPSDVGVNSHGLPDVHNVSATTSEKLVDCQAAAMKHQSSGEGPNGCEITSSSDKHSSVTSLTAPQIKVALI